jgi:hypothetical protein
MAQEMQNGKYLFSSLLEKASPRARDWLFLFPGYCFAHRFVGTLKNDLFAQAFRYVQNFFLGILVP